MATKSPTQHHSYWGVVASASQLPNVSGATIQDAAVEAGDTAYVTGSGTYQCDDATVGAAVWSSVGSAVVGIGTIAAPAEKVVWAWNGVDTSQLATPLDIGAPTGTLTVAPFPTGYDTPTRNRLLYSHTGTGANRIYLIDDLPDPMPNVFIIEIVLGPRGATLGSNTTAFLWIAGQDTTHFLTFNRHTDNVTPIVQAYNNISPTVGGCYRFLGGAILSNADEGQLIRLRVEVRDPDTSNDPGISIVPLHPSEPDISPHRFSADAMTPSGGATCPAAGWHSSWRSGGTIKNIGIAFEERGNPGVGYVSDLRILEPMQQITTTGGGGTSVEYDWATNYLYTQQSPVVEKTIGHGYMDGADVGGSIYFRAVLNPQFSVAGSAQVKLYDVGPALGPPAVPTLIATLTVSSSGLAYVQEALSIAGSPGLGQIADSARMYEVTVTQTSQVGDTVLVGSAGVSDRANFRIEPPAVVPAQTELWAWDKTSVTQLGDGVGGPTASDIPTTGSLSVGAFPAGLDCAQKPRLEYAHTNAGALAFFEIRDLPDDFPDDFVLEFKLGPRESSPGGLTTNPQVVLAYQDITHWFSVYRGGGLTNAHLKCANNNNGKTAYTYKTTITSLLNNQEGSHYRIACSYNDPTPTSDPGCEWVLQIPTYTGRRRANSTGWNAVGGATPPSTSWDGGWRTGGTIKRIGIMFEEMGTSPNPGLGWISDLRILSWAPLG